MAIFFLSWTIFGTKWQCSQSKWQIVFSIAFGENSFKIVTSTPGLLSNVLARHAGGATQGFNGVCPMV
jgi:phage terminase large subunit-like protein